MLLSEELFQEICGICILEWRNGESERREHPRVEFGRRATVMAWIDGSRGPARVAMIRDLSLKGVALLQSEKAGIGDQFLIDVTKFVGHPLGIRCTVERTEPGGSGGTQFVVGATFATVIESADELIPGPEPIEVVKVTLCDRWRATLRRCFPKLAVPKRQWLKFSRDKSSLIAERLIPR